MALPFKGTSLIVTPALSRGTRDRDTNLEPRIVFGNTFLFATFCLLQLHAVSFWCTQSSWLGVKYRLTNWLFMLSERKLNQTCAAFSDHCINGTTCDPDTKICVTEDSKCCLYAIPGVLSTPFLSVRLSLITKVQKSGVYCKMEWRHDVLHTCTMTPPEHFQAHRHLCTDLVWL